MVELAFRIDLSEKIPSLVTEYEFLLGAFMKEDPFKNGVHCSELCEHTLKETGKTFTGITDKIQKINQAISQATIITEAVARSFGNIIKT